MLTPLPETSLPDVSHVPISDLHVLPPVLARLLRELPGQVPASPFQSYLTETPEQALSFSL